ncbi:MAG: sulfite exporter TauE/SafE family protein [Bacteroidia bacterium]|jgi:uncharacterized membrane protein YfcA|nr:sulfite exporter TauE/SafE family protein [Bacteroidia bacterium]GIV23494.1 MAG: UPF0721 transmembrane protein [Bacteroidia bacterium]
MELFTGLLVGIVGGLLSGLTGVGGAIVMIPLLTLGLGLDHHTAQGTTLMAFSFPVLGLAAWRYWKAGRVLPRLSLALAIGMAIASFLSGRLVQNLPTPILQKVFAAFLLIATLYLLWRNFFAQTREVARLPRQPLFWWGVLGGLITGALSGLTGLGGGIIMVPYMVYILRLDQHTAQGTSLMTLSFPVLIFAAWPYFTAGRVALQIGAGLAIGMIAASFLTATFAQKIQSRRLAQGFSLLLLAVSLLYFFR